MFGKQTKWEKLGSRIEEERAKMEQVETQLKAANEEFESACIAGGDTTKALEKQEQLQRQVNDILQAISVLQREREKYEVEHLEIQIKRLGQEAERVIKSTEPDRKRYEKLKKEFYETEKDWFGKNSVATRKVDAIREQQNRLQNRLNRLTEEPAKPEHSVEEWLQLLRNGKAMVPPADDFNFDQANHMYKQELDELHGWAFQARLTKKVTGTVASMPKFTKYYPRERLESITGNM